MENNKHTPGPWFIETPNFEVINVCAKDKFICEIEKPIEVNEDTDEKAETAKANAALISAAPDLLEALQEIVKSYCVCIKKADQSEFVINAKAAITKATLQQ